MVAPKYPTAWSYSALSLYESCPRRHMYAKVEKIKEPMNEHLIRGNKVHNEAAKFLSGEVNQFPTSCAAFRDEFYELRDMHPIVEQKWAFNDRWIPTGYFAKDVRVRVILDVGLNYEDGTAEVIDHKTGKRYDDDYMDQLGLFAGAVMKMFRDVKHVTTRLWYMDANEEVVEEIGYDQAMATLADLEERAEVMLSDRVFPPRPSWKCKGCHFSKRNGGPCEF